MSMNINALVCGNGPSLKNIDYKRLPKQFDVFRCNQFYFEDRYFVGKDVKYVFFNPFVFFEQYYTSKKLIQNEEYNIENIVCSTINLEYIDGFQFVDNFELYFSDAFLG
ncbi:alpha-2,3 sialyltransferase, partial [Campylobacter jejuni]|nr:alpha-2,3 sialyltransferase [Campylobacter jejuni]EFP2931130.1 alpha-2,3 sialyltransferase [Campylobacter jejuni]